MIEKEITEKTVEVEKIIKVHCDGNGCDKKEYSGSRKHIWNDYDDDCERTTVSARLIIGGRYVDYDFDVCPTCFAQKIVPLFNGDDKSIKNRVEWIRDQIICLDEATKEELKELNKKSRKSPIKEEKTVKYTLWTEDLGSWMSLEYGPILFDTREEAEEHLKKYCKRQNADDLLACVEKVEV